MFNKNKVKVLFMRKISLIILISTFLFGNDINKISKDTDRDNFMNAKEAQDYGIVDGVLESRKDIK